MGHFNAVESKAAVIFMTGKEGLLVDREEVQGWKAPLRLAFFEKHPEEPGRQASHGWSGKMARHAMIDQVLLSPRWQVPKTGIAHFRDGLVGPSDHFPVFATVSWKEE
jgi:endonuclease/exonuclease/phosphatase family metal-dependent hydrolase